MDDFCIEEPAALSVLEMAWRQSSNSRRRGSRDRGGGSGQGGDRRAGSRPPGGRRDHFNEDPPPESRADLGPCIWRRPYSNTHQLEYQTGREPELNRKPTIADRRGFRRARIREPRSSELTRGFTDENLDKLANIESLRDGGKDT